jgi:hypothetical protein
VQDLWKQWVAKLWLLHEPQPHKVIRTAGEPMTPASVIYVHAGGARAWEALPANPRSQPLCVRPRPDCGGGMLTTPWLGSTTSWAVTTCLRHWPPSVRGA